MVGRKKNQIDQCYDPLLSTKYVRIEKFETFFELLIFQTFQIVFLIDQIHQIFRIF